MANKIKVPNGVHIRHSQKGAKVNFTFDWSSVFEANANYVMNNAQSVLSNDVIRFSTPYVPILTGVLRDSVYINSDIENGKIVWSTPYARRRYYEGRMKGIKGSYWFERMLSANWSSILTDVKKEIKKI